MSDEIKALVEREKKLIDLIISMYHTTRLSDTPFADHIHSKAIVREAFANYRAAALTAQADEIERLRKAIIKEREDNLWEAYHSGNVKDGQWTHMFMSDGEWLARECGLDPSQGHYDDAEVHAAIPKAAADFVRRLLENTHD